MTGAAEMVPQHLADKVTEYKYCRLFPATTHDQYLDLPVSHVQWMLEIDNVFERVRAEAQRRASC